jgi:hypothetical protein
MSKIIIKGLFVEGEAFETFYGHHIISLWIISDDYFIGPDNGSKISGDYLESCKSI